MFLTCPHNIVFCKFTAPVFSAPHDLHYPQGFHHRPTDGMLKPNHLHLRARNDRARERFEADRLTTREFSVFNAWPRTAKETLAIQAEIDS